MTKKYTAIFGILALAALLGLSGCAADSPVVEGNAIEGNNSSLTAFSADQRYIVAFANGRSQRGRSALAAAGGRVLLDLPSHNMAAAELPNGAVTALRSNPNIDFVEVDERRVPQGESTPYGITMVNTDAVSATPASGRVQVCIIDSGISAGHEDFAGVPLSGTNDSGTGDWGEDRCGHGTHVAGTVAAAAGNGIGVRGVAPDAVSLHIVKVFSGTDCGWTYSSGLIAALDACRAAGAQVVSMSLGGSRSVRSEDRAFQQAWDAGVLSIAAAGNDGNTRKSYPASYDSVVSVAAIDSASNIASFSQQNDQVEIAAPGVGVMSTYPYANSLTAGGTTYSGGGMEGGSEGDVNGVLVDGGLCDSVGAWAGAVVLCSRGDISFEDKVRNVVSGGGAAAVVYNNVAGGFSGTLGTFAAPIPAISLSQADGLAALASAGSTGNVLSGYGDGYAAMDGTSMATPHVSGVAGLLWAQFPGATNADIRDAMNATATDLGAAGRDNAYGYGLVNAGAAYDHLAAGGGGGGGGTDPEVCGDGVDNDGDGATDCDDSDCSSDPSCDTGGGGGTCDLADVGESCRDGADCCSGVCSGGRPSSRVCLAG